MNPHLLVWGLRWSSYLRFPLLVGSSEFHQRVGSLESHQRVSKKRIQKRLSSSARIFGIFPENSPYKNKFNEKNNTNEVYLKKKKK